MKTLAMTTAENTKAWPSGSSEMGRRIREYDWAATPLGPIKAWPQHVKTVVDLLLAHGFPMAALWGREHIKIYNDAYRAILGAKHPATLGRPLHEVWPEVRHINEPLLERVWAGETVSLEDAHFRNARFGAPEDAWYTLTLSPLRDDTGLVAGALLTVFETTSKLTAERELRDRAERQAFFLKLSDALRPLADPAAIQGEATRLLAERLDVDRAYYVEIDEAAGLARVEQDYARGAAPSLAGDHLVAGFGWSVEILRRGNCHVISDTQTSSLVPPADRPASAALQIPRLHGDAAHQEGSACWGALRDRRSPTAVAR